jgi:catechol 2,3-dioxygenase-like lactoylglutathione lyase family enzyme
VPASGGRFIEKNDRRGRSVPLLPPDERNRAWAVPVGGGERRGRMLGKTDPTPMIAVKDLDRARAFYEETLGLETTGTMGEEVVSMKSGDSRIDVYRSKFAGTNKATALTFNVPDIGAEVRELKDKGVMFEHYDMDGLTRDGDIYTAEGMKTAWFKDPDGNILSLIEG